jgi:hypothetical protein
MSDWQHATKMAHGQRSPSYYAAPRGSLRELKIYHWLSKNIALHEFDPSDDVGSSLKEQRARGLAKTPLSPQIIATTISSGCETQARSTSTTSSGVAGR